MTNDQFVELKGQLQGIQLVVSYVLAHALRDDDEAVLHQLNAILAIRTDPPDPLSTGQIEGSYLAAATTSVDTIIAEALRLHREAQWRRGVN